MALQLRDDGLKSTDASLAERVERIVRLRTAARVQDLQVTVLGNEVILTGVAPTYYVKQLATHAALDEIEAFSLTNDIVVD
jgi:hypothetical protein